MRPSLRQMLPTGAIDLPTQTTNPMAGRLIDPGAGDHGAGRRDGYDRYLQLLGIVLLGYAMLGKGFAYIGAPPVFIGEAVLLGGLLVLAASGRLLASLACIPSLLLLALMGWVLLRTLPYVGVHGVDALRDSVVAMYGIFAFVMAALILQRPLRLLTMLDRYGRFVLLFTLAMPLLFPAFHYLEDRLPVWPHTGVPIVSLRSGEVATHVAGVFLFMVLGFRRVGTLRLLLLAALLLMIASQSRGGMLAAVVPIAFVLALVPLRRPIVELALLLVLATGLALVLDLHLDLGAERSLSARQVALNLVSIFASTHDQLGDTKAWRLEWWRRIVGYTFGGDYFWSGKGFGVNLTQADGIPHTDVGPPLRSPHNAHMTFLARGGVPGLALWMAVCMSWSWTMLRLFFESRGRGDHAWSHLFLFVFGYWLAILVNASFDVALEGPMMGIWFWCLFGTGIGAAALYRHERSPRPVFQPRPGASATPAPAAANARDHDQHWSLRA